MKVKHEIKSQLAKLLATEDLIVEHKNVQTAQFEVRTRVLTLPNWDKASNNVYDSLVAHEVGHALYTPDRDWWKEKNIPHSFMNIVEDVRIEKLMKRRYAGLAKTFYNGYNELNDEDFFDIDGKDLTDFNLADRVNLYFKIGAWNDISFSDTETSIVDLIRNAETFDETLSAAEALYNYCKAEIENKQKEEIDSISGNSIEGGGNSTSDNDDSDEFAVPDADTDASMEDGSSDDVDNTGMDSGGGSLGGETSDEPEVETAQSLDDALKNLTNLYDGQETVYVELPKINLKKVVIDNKVIHTNLRTSWTQQQEEWEKMLEDRKYHVYDIFNDVDQEYVKFKRSAQKEVNYLVKEFECKKAASSYARATTSKTGVLDCTKLHTYKYNEDLFKKVTTLAEGKNHGLVFVLDWSGSMCDVMLDTLKQLYNLLWFCKKVNIPFEVYAFTNEHPPAEGEYHRLAYEKKEGLAFVPECFSMMNLFTSKVKGKELEVQMKDIFRLASAFGHQVYTQYHIPIGMGLSGTPLNESIVALHQIIPQFKNENNVEKVQCVILTDGESAPIKYSKEFQRDYEDEPWFGTQYMSDKCVLRNRKTGHTYSCAGLGHWADVTDLMLQDIRQSFPSVNFIGIRVLGNRDASQFLRRYTGYDEGNGYENMMKIWKKEKSFTIKTSGYHSYFGLSSNALANEDEFEVKQDATKAQIKRAFVKSLRGKKMNKKILGEFIELVV